MSNQKRNKRQTGFVEKHSASRGFSLVELMVAITIGLILLAGISSVMVSTKRSYNTQDSLGRLQENARIAMVILERALRNAGYIGCNIDSNNVTNLLDQSGDPYNFNLDNLLQGSESGSKWYPSGDSLASTLKDSSGPITPRAGTDLFYVKGAESDGTINVQGKMTQQSASLKVGNPSGITTGDILILSDCSSTDIFQASGKTTSGSFDNIIHNPNNGSSTNPGNIQLGGGYKLSKLWNEDSQLMRYTSSIYYIATGKSGEPALFRRRIGNNGAFTPEELVEGIENLQILYGEDTDNDSIADVYRKADVVSNWGDVVTVRFGIIARALANLSADRRTSNRVEDTKALDIDGDGVDDFTGTETTSTTSDTGVTTKDRLYDRRMFRTTVLLRNFQNQEAS
jgi:type IV pilus assembly protein PilW